MSTDAPTSWSDAGQQELDDRLVVPLDPLHAGGWRLKVYGISSRAPGPRPDLVDAARRLAVTALPDEPTGDGRHGVGFLVVHDGNVGRWALLFWWSHTILLSERLFWSPPDGPPVLERVTDGLLACVYELPLVEWERRAWLRSVVGPRTGPDAYLADVAPCGTALTLGLPPVAPEIVPAGVPTGSTARVDG